MRLAVFQSHPARADKAANLARLREVARASALAGADVLVCSELFLTRYNIGAETRRLAEPLDGPSVSEARGIARDSGCAIVLGYPELACGAVHNSAAMIGADGEVLANYRKINLFGDAERSLFVPGDRVPTVPYKGRRIALGICYDIELPEFGRLAAAEGADLLLVPTANMAPYWEVPTTMLRARALENRLTIAYVNLHGRDETYDYTGLSGVVGPDGLDLARAGRQSECLLIVDVAA
ncbi:carbon-nitrogen hydrolase family protein [Rubellimicrobium aerolatum]|uniref:Carbon-nitrogen hydrolase family protein n=1 Tax=Rubellimicrobium aerolatum TaxID=490979 RepID=A0ABW0SGG8_9RHOB|nr:carbon-nitrogen hydrolase family protein [Rubellimicrobium aerolatum]MBP1807444.1 putative amidohydrolase [Rubellimicrobium aerolatum]